MKNETKNSKYAKQANRRAADNSSIFKLVIAGCFLMAGIARLTAVDRIEIIQAIAEDSSAAVVIDNDNPAASYYGSDQLTTFTPSQQKEFLKSFGRFCTLDAKYSSPSILPIIDVYNQLDQIPKDGAGKKQAEVIQTDLWKFCALGSGYASAYVDYDQVYLPDGITINDILRDRSRNHVVVFESGTGTGTGTGSDEKQGKFQMVNSAMMSLRTDSGREVAKNMVQLLVANAETLVLDNNYAVWKGRQLLRLVDEALLKNSAQWKLFRSRCAGLHTIGFGIENIHSHTGYCARNGASPCCQVEYSSKSDTSLIFLMNHAVDSGFLGYNQIGNGSSVVDSQSHVSVVEEVVPDASPFPFEINGRTLAPRLVDILVENDCLPSYYCHSCLRGRSGSDMKTQCEACKEQCSCYCEALCKIKPHTMKVTKECHVQIPPLKKNANRLIPKIVHQTYFEPVTEETHPNFSRLVSSWTKSGWEYNFYDDAASEAFLDEHFPPEVREAYETLIPGAYKADLFRYCVLLIHGGIYSDVDVLLSTDLDKLLEDDVGFMVPVDEVSLPTSSMVVCPQWNASSK